MLSEVWGTTYEFAWTRTFDAGLMALVRNDHDACLVDYRIGNRTGIELLQTARSHGCRVPILFLTGQQEPEIDLAALKAGAADFLVKGDITGSALDRAIRYAVERSRAMREAAEGKVRLAAFGANVGRALTRHAGVPEVLAACAQAIADYLPIELAQIHVFSPRRSELELAAAAGPLKGAPPSTHPVAVDFLQGGACLSCPVSEDHRLTDRDWMESNRILSAVTYPLMMNAHLLGLITLYSSVALSQVVMNELESVVPGIASYLARLALEAQVRRTQQMECVGGMAAGLAHEFKNNLMVIRAHIDQAIPECAAGSRLRDRLHQIVEVTEAANRLAQQLMLFARPQALEPRPLDLNEALGAMRPMIQGAVDQRVTVCFQCEAHSPVVMGDPGLLQQVIINLAVNARDAMPDGGTLTLATRNVAVDAVQAATNPDAVTGHFVQMEVGDTGCGMPPETLARMFEPFFTTKPPGKGNGLGLATVFNIVREHSGWIEVRSQVGKGTTFLIYLPECREACSAQTTPPLPDPPLGTQEVRGNNQSVLVVEDEPVLRLAAEQTLRRANYDVAVAGSGQEALRLWEERGGRFDVLLTDLSMPEGMTGMQLASQLVKANPTLKVILTSGYAQELVESELEGSDAVFLQKPYPPSLLPQAVGKCLGI
jgi:signal transduction histidine kinase/DNA-binding response OmpR family regulator